MDCQTVRHDSDEFGMDLILVLLIVLPGLSRLYIIWILLPTHPFQLVKLCQHYSLLGTKMPPDEFPDVWDEGDDNGKRLGGEC